MTDRQTLQDGTVRAVHTRHTEKVDW